MYKLLIYVVEKYVHNLFNIYVSFIYKHYTLLKAFSLNAAAYFKKLFRGFLIFFSTSLECVFAFVKNYILTNYNIVYVFFKKNKNYFMFKPAFIFIKILELFLLNFNYFYIYLRGIIQKIFLNYVIFILYFSVFLKYFCFSIFSRLFPVFLFLSWFFFFTLYIVDYYFNIFLIAVEVMISKLYSTYSVYLIYLIDLFILYKPVLIEKTRLFKKDFKSFLYNKIYYEYFLGAFWYWSHASYSHTGRSFTSREDIIENYKNLWPTIKKYWTLAHGYYDLRYHSAQFYYFYKIFVINIFSWTFKNYIVNILGNMYVFVKKYMHNFLFVFFILIFFKFIKVLFVLIFLNFFKFKLFSMPLYVIFNQYGQIKQRFRHFFKAIRLRRLNYFTRNWLLPTRIFRKKRFFKKNFDLKYVRQSWKVLHQMHSLWDIWSYKLFLNNVFVLGIRNVYRWFRGYRLYKMSIKFKHKFGMSGRFDIIKTIFRDIFYFSIAFIFKYAYVMAHVFAYIINKIIYIIKKITGNGNE